MSEQASQPEAVAAAEIPAAAITRDPARDIVPGHEHLEPAKSVQSVIQLPDGEALNSLSAIRVTGRSPTTLVVLAGAEESGKTTLAAALYQQFQNGPFAGLSFAGSETLIGWEQRCHLARLESMGESPDTERTGRAEPMRFLHLAVRPVQHGGRRTDLLIADVSGETYTRATDHEDDARALSVLLRANWLVLLLDGERLCGPDRHLVAEQAGMLLRSCLEIGLLGRWSRVEVAFSKWDVVERSVEREGVESLVEQTRQDFRRRFAHHLADLRFDITAARGLPTAGLDRVLATWLEGANEVKVGRIFNRFPDASQYANYAWKAAMLLN